MNMLSITALSHLISQEICKVSYFEIGVVMETTEVCVHKTYSKATKVIK